jgi:hypothetical protein
MIYNGQEVGEDGIENVGFAGSRNRTSIFDYASMPELLKWVNKKKYDGRKLSAEQLSYRNFYVNLLNFCNSNDAIINGDFYDLQYINRHNQSEGYDERFVYSFLRYTTTEKFLVVTNFNTETDYDIYIKIPPEALELLSLADVKKIKFEEIIENKINIKVDTNLLTNVKVKLSGFHFNLKPSAAYIFKIS